MSEFKVMCAVTGVYFAACVALFLYVCGVF